MSTVSLNPTSHDVDGKRRRLELWTKFFSEEFWPALSGQERALIQVSGPLSAMPLPCPRADSHSLVLLRRLHFPLLLSTLVPMWPSTRSFRVCFAGFLAEGVTRWRVPLPGFAASLVRGSAPMSWDMDLLDWKTGSCRRWSVSLEVHYWRLTRRWSLS